MVRIISPFEFPVDWKNRMIKYEIIDDMIKKEDLTKNNSYNFGSFEKSANYKRSFTSEPARSNFSWFCIPGFGSSDRVNRESESLRRRENAVKI